MILSNGKKIAEKKFLEIEEELKKASLSIGVVQIGENSASNVYVNVKRRELEKRGISFSLYKLSEDVSTQEVKEKVLSLNEDGIVVQLPLPENLDREEILDTIPKEKDIDLLSSISCGMFYKGISKILPPVVRAVETILEEGNISIKGKKVTLVGGGSLVGKPLSIFLARKGATVTITNKDTKDLSFFTKNADILVSGTGIPGLIKDGMITNETVVIDAGNSDYNGEVKGDVDKEAVKLKNGLFSPVPGGVGPLTVYFLAENLLKLKKNDY